MAINVKGTCKTSDPTLTNNTEASLKLNTTGDLRVSIANTSVPTTPGAGELHLGQVTPAYTLVDVVPTLDTSAYTSGDVLFVATVVTDALRVADGYGLLKSIQLIDKDDQGVACDLYFFNSAVTTGAFNGAPSISDADLAFCLGYVAVAAGDYKDLGGARVATKNALDIMLKAVSGLKTIYVAAVTGGTPTHTAAGITLRLGIIQS